MVIRKSFGFGLAVLTLLALTGGCRRSESQAPKDSPTPVQKQQAVVRLHWIGRERLYADTNAAYLTNMLQMPEATKWGEGLLQKFSRAPWALSAGVTNAPAASNNASGLLLSLLHTVVASESYLEVSSSTNQPFNAAMAIRFNAEGAALWESNSTAILDALPGVIAMDSREGTRSWRIERDNHTNYLQIQKAGDWTLLGLGQSSNSVVADFASRIQGAKSPCEGANTNHWLELECDLARLLPALSASWKLPMPAPRLDLSASGDGEYLKIQGELNFPQPLHVEREPWMIPTNMIREPLVSFGAMQGLRPWLKTIKWIQDLQITNVPNQMFTWSISTSPVHVFAATPLPDASAVVDRVGPGLEKQINSWLTNHASAAAEFSAPNHGISWIPVPLLTPTFQALPGLGGGLLFGRFAPSLPPPGQTAPPELLGRVTSRTNLVYYDWEITEMRLKQWMFLAQSLRVAFRRAQVPGDCDSFAFLKAIAPKLGNTVTEVSQKAPSTLSFVRKSHIGLTGVELHLLADWAESPTFPVGLYSDLPGDQGAVRWNAKTKSLEPAGKAGPGK
jgi:hypothetical protein